MTIRRIVASVLAAGVVATPVCAQWEWFPEEVRAGLQASVSEKLLEIDEDGSVTPDRAQEAGRVAVDGVAAKLESLGLERVVQMAPTFPELGVPTSGTSALDAIAAYQLCSVPLDVEYRNESPRDHRYDMRAWALFLSSAVFVVSTYLRPAYLEAGVTDEQAEAWLYGETMMGLRARVQASRDLLRATKDRCADPLVTLMQ